MSAGTDYAIAELQHAVRELAARVDSIEQARSRFPAPRDLSPGSTVTDRYGSQWTKQADPPGMWKGGSNMVTDGILTLVFGPFRKVSEPVRNIDDFEPLESLSVGERVRTTNGIVWEKQGDGMWSSDSGSRLESVRLWVRHGPVFVLLPE